jgi:molybdate transport system ATP-binding protein
VIQLDVRLPLPRFTLRVEAELAGGVAVLGPSGSGKTSLLETIAGLQPRARGRIQVDGVALMDDAAGIHLSPERRGVGYVPQDALLFPHRDVAWNVRFGLPPHAPPRLVDELVEILEIAPLLRRFPSAISGGERQRVALARALATRPRLLLLDEPLAALDVELKERILPYLLRVRDALGIPFLYVTHNAGEAAAVAEEALLLRAGEVVRHGPVDRVLAAMAAERVDPAARYENVLSGALEARAPGGETAIFHARGARLVVPAPPAGEAPPGRTVFSVAPEDILVSEEAPERVSARNRLFGRVVAVRDDEDGAWLRVDAEGIPWTVRLTRAAEEELALSPGAAVWLTIKAHSFRRLS